MFWTVLVSGDEIERRIAGRGLVVGDRRSGRKHGWSLRVPGFEPHDDSQDEEHHDEGGDARDDGGDPMNPSKGIAGGLGELEGLGLGAVELRFQSVEVKLLEQVLSLKRGHTSLVFQGGDGGLKVVAGMVSEDSLGIPGPFKDLRSGESLVGPNFAVDLMLLQLQAAALGHADD